MYIGQGVCRSLCSKQMSAVTACRLCVSLCSATMLFQRNHSIQMTIIGMLRLKTALVCSFNNDLIWDIV